MPKMTRTILKTLSHVSTNSERTPSSCLPAHLCSFTRRSRRPKRTKRTTR